MASKQHALAAFAVLAALSASAQSLPAFPPANVADSFFGTVVDDPYRALENTGDPAVQAWMKAQAAHAHGTLRSLSGYARLLDRVAELDNARDALVGEIKRNADGTLFFTRRSARDNTFKLFRRSPSGAESQLVDPDDWQRETGKPHAINYFFPSPDGRLVAVGVSAAGSEDASLHVIETATRKRVGEPIDRAEYAGAYAGIHWMPDGRSFFHLRLRAPLPGAAANERYHDMTLWRHTVGQSPKGDLRILGPNLSPRVPVAPTEQAFVVVTPGSKYAVAMVVADVQREVSLYAAPLASVGRPGTPWTRICGVEDKVTAFTHVKPGTAYPAVLLVHGANDPRVAVWHSTKTAARLQAATTSGKPVLLDLDFDSGHGIGDTKTQRQRQVADTYAFLLWQAGHPDFQPKAR
jgi:prolyl oligopeptidase